MASIQPTSARPLDLPDMGAWLALSRRGINNSSRGRAFQDRRAKINAASPNGASLRSLVQTILSFQWPAKLPDDSLLWTFSLVTAPATYPGTCCAQLSADPAAPVAWAASQAAGPRVPDAPAMLLLHAPAENVVAL